MHVADPALISSNEVLSHSQYLTFQLAGAEYGIAVLSVREIIEYRSITSVPMTPDWMLGVINLRGSVLPVVDLARRFDNESSEVTKRTCIVIVEAHINSQLIKLGIVVDAVREVIFLEDEDIQEAPGTAGRPDLVAVEGIVHLDGRFVLLIDCERAFDFESIDAILRHRPENQGSEPDAGGGAKD